jgi:hypothetical protein
VTGRVFRGGLGLGVNEVYDRLGLREVEPPV